MGQEHPSLERTCCNVVSSHPTMFPRPFPPSQGTERAATQGTPGCLYTDRLHGKGKLRSGSGSGSGSELPLCSGGWDPGLYLGLFVTNKSFQISLHMRLPSPASATAPYLFHFAPLYGSKVSPTAPRDTLYSSRQQERERSKVGM